MFRPCLPYFRSATISSNMRFVTIANAGGHYASSNSAGPVNPDGETLGTNSDPAPSSPPKRRVRKTTSAATSRPRSPRTLTPSPLSASGDSGDLRRHEQRVDTGGPGEGSSGGAGGSGRRSGRGDGDDGSDYESDGESPENQQQQPPTSLIDRWRRDPPYFLLTAALSCVGTLVSAFAAFESILSLPGPLVFLKPFVFTLIHNTNTFPPNLYA